MDYDFVVSSDVDTLKELVADRLKLGWALHGTPFVFGGSIMQCVIRTVDTMYTRAVIDLDPASAQMWNTRKWMSTCNDTQ